MTVTLDLPHSLAGHCGSGALRDLCAFHGLSWSDEPISEDVAFGLGGSLAFTYLEIPELAPAAPPIYLVGRSGDLEVDFCKNVGVELDLRQTDNPDEAWRWVKSELDAGRPTMVWADIAELDYLRVKMSNTHHDIVLCGYDEDESVVLVADNDREEVQACSRESLARARMSSGFPSPNRNATFFMRWPDELRDPVEAIRAAVDGSILTMRTASQSVFGGEVTSGLAAVDHFVARYPHWPDLFGESLPAALSGLRVFIAKAGTGGAMFRGLQAGFLEEAGELLGDELLRDAGELYRRLETEWIGLADSFASGEVRAQPVAAHARGLAHVERIGVLEREGIRVLERWSADAPAAIRERT